MKKFLAPFLLALAVIGLAGCNKSGNNQNSTDLRVLNAVPDAEPLDVLIADDPKVTALAANATSSFVNFSSGTQDTKVRSSSTQAILLDTSLGYASGIRNTLILFGKRAAMGTLLLPEDQTAPSSGKVRVRAVDVAPDAGGVDVYLTTSDLANAGTAILASVTGGAVTSAAEVTAGSFKIIVTAAGTQEILFQSPSTYTFNAGSSVSLVVMPTIGGKLVSINVLESGSSGPSTYIANPNARMKAVNGITDATGINFKVDGTTLLSNVPFTGNSSYVNVAAGSRNISIEATNVPGTSIASVTTTLANARDYTVLAYGKQASPTISTLVDDNTLPAANFVKLRFVNAMADGASVDVLVNFASQATGIAPGKSSGYSTVAAGTNYNISFTTPGGVTLITSLTGVELDSQQVYTAYLFGTTANAQAKLVRDR
jgi:hypothetical protein